MKSAAQEPSSDKSYLSTRCFQPLSRRFHCYKLCYWKSHASLGKPAATTRPFHVEIHSQALPPVKDDQNVKGRLPVYVYVNEGETLGREVFCTLTWLLLIQR